MFGVLFAAWFTIFTVGGAFATFGYQKWEAFGLRVMAGAVIAAVAAIIGAMWYFALAGTGVFQ